MLGLQEWHLTLEQAAGFQHTHDLGGAAKWAGDMFEDSEGENSVEGAIRKR